MWGVGSGEEHAIVIKTLPVSRGQGHHLTINNSLILLPIQHCKTMIDKLDMKSTAMRAKQWREEEQMRSKEDVGGALCKVDFEQLKIENTRFAEVMDERNHELLNLKVLVGNTNNQLMSLKVGLGG